MLLWLLLGGGYIAISIMAAFYVNYLMQEERANYPITIYYFLVVFAGFIWPLWVLFVISTALYYIAVNTRNRKKR